MTQRSIEPDHPASFPARSEEHSLYCAAPEDMERAAALLAPALESGGILLLWGDLGAGKTTLTQYLARALGVGRDQYVASPSFALLHEYRGRLPLFHLDLYRLRDEADIEDAGLDEVLCREGLVVVEWPERLGTLTPAERLDIRLSALPGGGRRLVLSPAGALWRQRLAGLRR